MKNQILFFILYLGTCILYIDSYAQQITRGAQEGELYISTFWYLDIYNYYEHNAIFRSVDNGATITLQYENNTASPPEEMEIGQVLGDATPGALYNIGINELWLSLDYGENWEYREDFSYANYASGFADGEIFRRSDYNLYRSDNYGNTFELIVESLSEPLSDVGNQNGQLYGFTGSAGIGYKLYYSQDFGNNFTMLLVDSLVAFWTPSGQFPRICRGAEPGELYLTSWWPWPDLHYKIYHSVDTGYTWTEKYESETIEIYYWFVAYSAGREPGSFYVMRSRLNPYGGEHIWLYIDYSSDYGETFTTYFHDLDSTITSVVPKLYTEHKLSNYPNPFTNTTNIQFSLPKNANNPVLNIYDIYGKVIRQYNIADKNIQQWDGRDKKGRKVSAGIYLYNINYGKYSSKFKKLLFIE